MTNAPATLPISITPTITFLASGSDISNPDAESGYDKGLVAELARVGCGGKGYRKIHLTAQGHRDFAEWLEAMEGATAQSDGPAVARSCRVHREASLRYAAELDRKADDLRRDAAEQGPKTLTIPDDTPEGTVVATGHVETARERKNRLARERRAAKKGLNANAA